MTDVGTNAAFPEGKDYSAWIATYSEACLTHKNSGTVDVYQRILRNFLL